MKRFGKKIAAVVLAMALMVAMAVPAFAANDPIGTSVPANVPLHILNRVENNATLNILTSSVPSPGTYVTTYADKSAYDGTHAFRRVSSGGKDFLCSDILVNGTYYNVGCWVDADRFIMSSARSQIDACSFNWLDDYGMSSAYNSYYFEFQFPEWGRRMMMSDTATGYGPYSYYISGNSYKSVRGAWIILKY